MKRRIMKFTALVMVFLVFSLIFPQASFVGVFGTSKAEAQQLGDSCGPGNEGVCTQINSNINKNGYFIRGYCPSLPLDQQCRFTDSSVEDCSSCTADSTLKWCWKDSTGYCASKTIGPAGSDQSCLGGYNPVTSQSACSTVPLAAGGTQTTTTPNQQTGSGEITLVTPNLIVNQQGMLEFIVPSNLNIASFELKVIHQQTGTISILSPPVVFTGVCPSSCRTTATLTRAGDYNYEIKGKNAQNQVVASGTGQFTVSASGTTQPSGTGDTRTCEGCQATGGKWCVSYTSYGYPSAQCIPGNANCPTSTTSLTTTYTNNCPSQTGLCEAACGSLYAQRYLQVNYGSQQTMVAGLPIGACYSRDLQVSSISVLIRSGQNANQAFLQSPQPLTGNFCENPNDVCWCSILNLGATATGGQSTVPGTTRTPHWPPDESYYVQDRPTAEPNAVDCSKKSDASIKARIAGSNQTGSQLKIFAAGQPVTIEGEVGYFSNVCNGYQYTCEKFQELICDYEKPKLSNTYTAKLSYKKCPSTLPTRIAAEGEKKDFCLGCLTRSLVNLAAVAATVTLLFIPGGAAFIPLVMSSAQCLNSLSPALDGQASCVNYAAAMASCGSAAAGSGLFGGGGSGSGSGAPQTGDTPGYTPPTGGGPPDTWSWSAPQDSEENKDAGFSPIPAGFGVAYAQGTGTWWYCYEKDTCSSGATFSAACYDGAGGPSTGPSFSTLQECQQVMYKTQSQGGTNAQKIQQGINAFIQLQAYSQLAGSCPLFDNNDANNCWSVCAKDYTTSAAAAPRCNFGGPVKSFTEAQYACSARSCGGFASQTVHVTVVHGDETLVTDTTTTDETGKFSYTFTAPNVDDMVTIILTTSI